MKVKELIEQLKQLPQDDKIVITAMDNSFCLDNFEVHSPYDDGQAQEIIMPIYVLDYEFEDGYDEPTVEIDQ